MSRLLGLLFSSEYGAQTNEVLGNFLRHSWHINAVVVPVDYLEST